MNERQCPKCGGRLKEGRADYESPSAIIVKDLPALICERCGEAYFREREDRLIERTVKYVKEQRRRAGIPILKTRKSSQKAP